MIESDFLDQAFAPLSRESLADRLAIQIDRSIRRGEFRTGERLPSIGAMARAFRVGPGSVRTALVKLEMRRIVEVRQGRGVFVIAPPNG